MGDCDWSWHAPWKWRSFWNASARSLLQTPSVLEDSRSSLAGPSPTRRGLLNSTMSEGDWIPWNSNQFSADGHMDREEDKFPDFRSHLNSTICQKANPTISPSVCLCVHPCKISCCCKELSVLSRISDLSPVLGSIFWSLYRHSSKQVSTGQSIPIDIVGFVWSWPFAERSHRYFPEVDLQLLKRSEYHGCWVGTTTYKQSQPINIDQFCGICPGMFNI